MAITPKQKAVFDYIKKYLDENGVSPTFDEIALHFNYRSKGTVYKHIKALRYNGLIRQEWNRPRSMKVSRPGAANRSYLPIKGEWVDKKTICTKPPYELINVPSGLTRNNRSFLIRMRNNAFQKLNMLFNDLLVVQPNLSSSCSGHVIIERKNGNHFFAKPAGIPSPYIIIGQTTGLFRIYEKDLSDSK